MFPTRTGSRRQKGKHLHRSVWRDGKSTKVDMFQIYLQKAGLIAEERHDKRPVRWHDLRHSCASSLIAGWWGEPWRLEDLMGLLGHSSITMTQRYAHLAPSRIQDLGSKTGGGFHNPPRGLCVGYDGPVYQDPAPKSSMISTVGRQGLEPWTYGLKARREKRCSLLNHAILSQL
jgi:hypothetical protein